MKYNLTIHQGSLFDLSMELRDPGSLFGTDLSDSTFRMQIRVPDRTGDPEVLSLVSGASTSEGSTINIFLDPIIGPVDVVKFHGNGRIEVDGDVFQETTFVIPSLDANGDPTGIEEVTRDIPEIGVLVRIQGSTSNDGDCRLLRVLSADEIQVCTRVKNEQAQGTVSVFHEGRFQIYITAEESEAWDFEVGEYDLEWLQTSEAEPIRLLQGYVKVDREVTR
jgi:hypothetical protein